MKMTKSTHRHLQLNSLFFYIILLAIIGGIAFVSTLFSYEFDWTYGNRNSLSTNTEQLLKTINKPLEVVAYLPNDDDLRTKVEKVIKKYQRIKPDIKFTALNPDLAPKQAAEDGVQYSGQLVLKLGEAPNQQKELLTSANESEIVSALIRMTRSSERIVVFIEGHGERQPLWTESNGLSRLTDLLEKSGFKIQPHNLLRTQSIPTNASLVVLAAPQSELLAAEVKLLEEYIQQGGNLLWLQDPGELKGLTPLEDLLTIQIPIGTVVDANERLQAMLGIKHPAVVPVIDYDPRSQLTKNLKIQTLFPFSTMIRSNPNEAKNAAITWKVEEFLKTLPQSWLEVDPLQAKVVYDDTKGDIIGPITIGLSLVRSMESDKDSAANKQQRIVVIGDSDFMTNGFIGEGGNLDLAVQIFNWLSRDDSLVGIKMNPAPDLTFNLEPRMGVILALFFLLGLPLILIGIGVRVWLKRRRL
ncbi:GldG family protein [Thiofilum flexile]|uniref:GldG family protein n=1 Tax=Thiofilum flexile TaxID=125627 RepID=UPI00037D8705|nr:GldG family protein [Thiofilum flexile]